MPLPLTVSCSSKSRLVLPFWCRLTRVVPDKVQEGRKIVVVVVVCVCVSSAMLQKCAKTVTLLNTFSNLQMPYHWLVYKFFLVNMVGNESRVLAQNSDIDVFLCFLLLLLILPTSLAREVMHPPPSVHLSVSTLSFELADLWPWSFASVWVTTMAHRIETEGQGCVVIRTVCPQFLIEDSFSSCGCFVQQIKNQSVDCAGGTNTNVLQLYSRSVVSSCKHFRWSSHQDTGICRNRSFHCLL